MDNEIKEYKDPDLTPAQFEQIQNIKNTIDITDTNAVISFGSAAQRKSSDFVDTILSTIKTKDLNETGTMLTALMSNIKSFDAGAASKENFLAKLFSSPKNKIDKLQTSYKNVSANIDQIVDSLEKHRTVLMQDTAMLDKLYEKSIDYAEELKLYILAGESRVKELQSDTLPALRKAAEASDDQLQAQKYKDAEDAVERLDKKVHDLKLTRMVTLQMLPQIRLQQASNNVLVDKIHSSIVNSLPLWKSQMVIALGLAHTSNALKAQKAVTDTTNELLRKNSEMLKTSTLETAKESERAIVDIDTIKKANEDIISSIQQVISIQQEGHRKREESENELLRLEHELKDTLLNVLTDKNQ